MLDELLAEMAWHSAYMRSSRQCCMNVKAPTHEQVALPCVHLRNFLLCLDPLIASSMLMTCAPISYFLGVALISCMAAAEQLILHVHVISQHVSHRLAMRPQESNTHPQLSVSLRP